jgi:hypothetical protein
VGFAPTAVSLLSKVSTVAFSLARLPDGPKSPSLLIRGKDIAVRIYSKWYGSTVSRSAAIASITSLLIGRIEIIRGQQETLEDVL